MDEVESGLKFKLSWAAWVAELADLAALATTPEESARVLRVKQAVDGSDVLAQLCHDVKDPLASVLMAASLLEKSMQAAEPAVETIASAAHRLDRVVTGAYDLAQLRRGEFQVRLQLLPIGSLVATIVEGHQRKAVRAIRIELAITGGFANVLGDAGATTRILQELLHNAIGFSSDGGVVDIRVSIEDADKPHVLVVIGDCGPGIDEAHLPHVFDEARNRNHRPRRGAGRGLPIAHALATLQGATLSIARRDPVGCEATLRMPLASRGTLPQS